MDVDVVVSQVSSRIAITPSDTTLTVLGDMVQFYATVYDMNDKVISDAEVNWTSDNPIVATVSSSGVVTASQNGTAGIRVTSGDATDKRCRNCCGT